MVELPESFHVGERVRAEWFSEILRRLRRLENLQFNPVDFDTIDSSSGRNVALAAQQKRKVTPSAIWPVVVRGIRNDNDHFVKVQDVARNSATPWKGIMAPTGSAYDISIWGHGKARDFRALMTGESEFTVNTPIITAVNAIGQPWVMQYLRFDLIQPRDTIRNSDCISAFSGGSTG